MQNKEKLVSLILRLILNLVLVTSASLILGSLSNGIVIGRTENKELIYSNMSLVLPKVLVIISIVLIAILVILDLIKLGNRLLEDSKNKKYIKITLYALFLIINIYTLIIFPIDQDKRNGFAFGFSLSNAIISITLILELVFSFIEKKETSKITVEVLSEGAIFAALAVVLSLISKMIPALELPNGGSFSLSMLPLFIFGLRRGVKAGAIMGFTYGVVNLLTDGFILHVGSIFFDYLIPFTLLVAVSGLFSKKAQEGSLKSVILAVLIGSFLRYVMHGLSGVIFFSDYADGKNVWFYSFILYNLPYMAVSALASLIFVIMLSKKFIYLETRLK